MKLLVQFIGGTLAFLGATAAVLFGMLFILLFLYVGLYGWGILAAVYLALPAVLVSVVICAFGWFIKKRADKMETIDGPRLHAPAYPPSYLLPQKKELS